LAVLLSLWHLTPLGETLDRAALEGWIVGFRDGWLGPPVALGMFLLGTLVGFPVTALIVINAAVFGPVQGLVQAMLGCLGGAALGYGLGRWLGRGVVRQLAGPRLNRLSQALGRRGVLSMALVRNLPLAPFTVVNLVAGVSHIRFVDYLLGTLLGMAPGMLALTVFADGLVTAIRNPRPEVLATTAAIVTGVGLLAWGLRRWLYQRQRQRQTTDT
ncbi:MAG: VTT domain-containing protein, partial [Candidatus Competibacterales bacterium]|nr:VTT domain-containing protein [Candidatus Competibacterales bacterium]